MLAAKGNYAMTKRDYYEQKLDATIRVHSAVWFSILEALGPDIARRAAANMYDLGLIYSDNPYCEELCTRLAHAELQAQSQR
jgi:hypothetical protein